MIYRDRSKSLNLPRRHPDFESDAGGLKSGGCPTSADSNFLSGRGIRPPLLALSVLLTSLTYHTPARCDEELTAPATTEILSEVKGFAILGNHTLLSEEPLEHAGIQFIGIDVPGGTKALQKVLQRYLGHPLTHADLHVIQQKILYYYRDRNHPLVHVHVPDQEITYGVISIVVEESKLGQINVYGNEAFSAQRYRDAIEIQPGEVIDESILLNNLNTINQNPFRRVDLVFAPGTTPETVNLDLVVRDRFPLNIYAGVDNTGLEKTERTRWFIGFNWANAFNLDQILSFQYTAAPDQKKFKAVTLSYAVPLPNQHLLTLYGGFSRVHVHLPSSSRTHGNSSQASLRYSIPLSPSPWLLHQVSCGFDFKRSNNTVEFVENNPRIGQEVNLTQFMAGYNLGYERDFHRWSHKVGFDLQLIFSPFSWLPNQSQKDFQSMNPSAQHTYVYGRGSLSYKIQLPHAFQWNALLAAQVSNQSLVPSEQFGLGGYNTVRGYEERQLNADDGLLLSTEVRSPQLRLLKKSKVKDGLEMLLFLDYGLAHDNHRLPKEKQTDYLLGAGPGVRYAIENYFKARLDWGIKLHRDHFPGGWSMVHFSVIGSF